MQRHTSDRKAETKTEKLKNQIKQIPKCAVRQKQTRGNVIDKDMNQSLSNSSEVTAEHRAECVKSKGMLRVRKHARRQEDLANQRMQRRSFQLRSDTQQMIASVTATYVLGYHEVWVILNNSRSNNEHSYEQIPLCCFKNGLIFKNNVFQKCI